MKPPADIADIVAKEDLRDELIRRVWTGELLPTEAVAKATEMNLRPFVRQPAPSDWLPRDRVSWTPLMTLAWIVYRSEHQVREHCDAWRAARILWRLNDQGGYRLSSQPPAYSVEDCSREALSAAECELNTACLAGKLQASGLADGARVEIPAVEWHGAETWARGDHPDCLTLLENTTPSYEKVRFQAADVMRVWPAHKAAPTPQCTVAEINSVTRLLAARMRNGALVKNKEEALLSLIGQFPKLTRRSFDKSWSAAVKESGKSEYSKGGRRPGAGKRKSKDAKPAKT